MMRPLPVFAATASSPTTATIPVVNYGVHSCLLVQPPVSVLVQLRLSFRLFSATVLGALVGKERSSKKHHPAGIRTLSLVSLGAALLTVCSTHGFQGKGDPSRMAANVASGVGFLGAGVITTTSSASSRNVNSDDEEDSHHQGVVHGLTTAAAIWLAAAVGVACGTGLHGIATVAAGLTIAVLRIGRGHQNVRNSANSSLSLRRKRDYFVPFDERNNERFSARHSDQRSSSSHRLESADSDEFSSVSWNNSVLDDDDRILKRETGIASRCRNGEQETYHQTWNITTPLDGDHGMERGP